MPYHISFGRLPTKFPIEPFFLISDSLSRLRRAIMASLFIMDTILTHCTGDWAFHCSGTPLHPYPQQGIEDRVDFRFLLEAHVASLGPESPGFLVVTFGLGLQSPGE